MAGVREDDWWWRQRCDMVVTMPLDTHEDLLPS